MVNKSIKLYLKYEERAIIIDFEGLGYIKKDFMTYKYPIYKPILEGNEKKYVNECLDTGWISSKGGFVSRFESAFADYLQITHSTTVSNGTVALHLALLAIGVSEGDEVIVPTLTYVASVNAIHYTGAQPVFVDSLATTWQIDPAEVERKITKKTKAILCVHLYGHPCNMDALVAICQVHKLFLVEDCAEALGTTYKGRYAGTFGDIATFSFYGNKTITTGEGGMVVTNDSTLYDRCQHFKGQGLAKYREYWHDVVGYNYRMTNLCAAIGLAQLERVQEIIQKKRMVAKLYQEALINSLYLFHEEAPDAFHSYWMCSILVERSNQRELLREHLAMHGIETRPLFYPVHTMPMYARRYERHQVAEDLGWRGINLPSYPALTKEDIMFISNTILSFTA